MSGHADSTPVPKFARRRRRRGLLVSLALTLVSAATLLAYFHKPFFENNLGVVVPGVVYRSAQPTGDVVGLIRSRQIASILNLRGGGPDDPWYAAEVDAIRQADADFYDCPMSATRRPSRRELLTILDVLARCKYPLLIHCKSGADRTGLATGLYLMSRRNVSPVQAESAFTLLHGHVPLFGPEKLHEPFREYAAWLAAGKLDHTPDRLLDWVCHEYRANDPLVAIEPVRPGPRVRRHASRSNDAAARR